MENKQDQFEVEQTAEQAERDHRELQQALKKYSQGMITGDQYQEIVAVVIDRKEQEQK